MGMRPAKTAVVPIVNPAVQGEQCDEDGDCSSGGCRAGLCMPVGRCDDATQTGTETDVDCGGECEACIVGQRCDENADCASSRCTDGRCVAGVDCSNFFQDETESDVDCGGTTCDPCALGNTCTKTSDCAEGECLGAICAQVAAHCQDELLSGDETDVDCGGSCGPCRDGASCAVRQDCASGVCQLDVCIGPIDQCRLQFPVEASVVQGDEVSVFGVVYEAGTTDITPGVDVSDSLVVQVGIGPDGALPDGNNAWSWVVATPNNEWDGRQSADGGDIVRDEYIGRFSAPNPGDYDTAVRASADGGLTWTYCDQGPAGSADGYSVGQAGRLVVNANDAQARGPNVDELIVTEIMQNPAGGDDTCCEWFEVHNPTDQSLLLNGVIIANKSDSFTIVEEVSIAPRQYFVFARNGAIALNGGLDVDYVYGDAFSLGNGLDLVRITNAEGIEVDEVAWDNGGFFPDPSGASMQLDGSVDVVSQENSVGELWCTATTPYGQGSNLGTPGNANASCEFANLEPFTTAEVEALMAGRCAGCHTNGGSSGGLNFDNFLADTVGVAAQGAQMNYIESGRRHASYLWHKIKGTHLALGGLGQQMPIGGPFGPTKRSSVLACGSTEWGAAKVAVTLRPRSLPSMSTTTLQLKVWVFGRWEQIQTIMWFDLNSSYWMPMMLMCS